jgi:hypothetical protein
MQLLRYSVSQYSKQQITEQSPQDIPPSIGKSIDPIEASGTTSAINRIECPMTDIVDPLAEYQRDVEPEFPLPASPNSTSKY